MEINWLLLWFCCFSHPSWVKGNSGKILGYQVPTKPKAKQGLVQEVRADEVGLERWNFKAHYKGISLQLVRGGIWSLNKRSAPVRIPNIWIQTQPSHRQGLSEAKPPRAVRELSTNPSICRVLLNQAGADGASKGWEKTHQGCKIRPEKTIPTSPGMRCEPDTRAGLSWCYLRGTPCF